MKADPHAKAEELCRILDSSGHGNFSESIRDAILSGATGTEIMLCLHKQMETLLSDPGFPKKQITLAEDICWDIKQLIPEFFYRQ